MPVPSLECRVTQIKGFPGFFLRKYSLDPLTGLLPGLARAKEAKNSSVNFQDCGSLGQVGWYCSTYSPTPTPLGELLPAREQESQCTRHSYFHLSQCCSVPSAMMLIAATLLSKLFVRKSGMLAVL